MSFTLGFLNMHVSLRRNVERLGITLFDVYTLTVLFALGTLAGGRALVVFNNEWEFYGAHPWAIFAVWIGGFASHGLIFGGAAGVLAFSAIRKVPFRPLLDVMAIAACFILGCGRIGNFIDGQIFGSLTDFPIAVQFPEAEGFRHPVVLYDGIKNFLLIPVLIWIRSRGVPPGRLAVWFIILYSELRIPIDMLRDYPISMWGFPTGQTLNFLMLGFGVLMLILNIFRSPKVPEEIEQPVVSRNPYLWLKLAFISLLVLPLVIPSDATRDIPDRYGKRHPGLEHSKMYPKIADKVNQ